MSTTQCTTLIQRVRENKSIAYNYCFFFALGVVKIPRAKNIKIISKVGMARSPVLHRQNKALVH